MRLLRTEPRPWLGSGPPMPKGAAQAVLWPLPLEVIGKQKEVLLQVVAPVLRALLADPLRRGGPQAGRWLG